MNSFKFSAALLVSIFESWGSAADLKWVDSLSRDIAATPIAAL